MQAEIGFLMGLLVGGTGVSILHLSRSSGSAARGADKQARQDDLVGGSDEHGKTSFERDLETRRLAAENAALITQMENVRERLATLERLAVDRSSRLVDEIEALRA